MGCDLVRVITILPLVIVISEMANLWMFVVRFYCDEKDFMQIGSYS